MLIRAQLCTMYELKNVYTLPEMLKLYALWRMSEDCQALAMEKQKSGEE